MLGGGVPTRSRGRRRRPGVALTKRSGQRAHHRPGAALEPPRRRLPGQRRRGGHVRALLRDRSTWAFCAPCRHGRAAHAAAPPSVRRPTRRQPAAAAVEPLCRVPPTRARRTTCSTWTTPGAETVARCDSHFKHSTQHSADHQAPSPHPASRTAAALAGKLPANALRVFDPLPPLRVSRAHQRHRLGRLVRARSTNGVCEDGGAGSSFQAETEFGYGGVTHLCGLGTDV